MPNPKAGTGSETQAGDPARPVNSALAGNIESMLRRRRESAASTSLDVKIASAISRFAGSMVFVYMHIVVFGGWIAVNAGLVPIIPVWDPSLVVLAMAASVEAIFLSTFVLINQNRMAEADHARSDLDLQINLLNEHETTRLIRLVDAIARHLGVQPEPDKELGELETDVHLDAVLDSIEEADRKLDEGR